jgi:glycosyltransferase involved in cell wall biosynthesis
MSQSLPTVSIVTPSFNHGEYLEVAVRSVLDQDYPRLEYLVADGGSTDASLEVVKKYESRLRWISGPDHGQADAINKGFSRMSGQILGWLNSDDAYAPGAIAAVVEVFARHPDVGVVYGDGEFIDAAGNLIGRCQHVEKFNRHRLLYYSDYIVQPAAFFRRDLFEKARGLDAKLNWAMDYDLWLKFSRQTRFEYLPRVLANYRWLAASKTGAGGAARLVEVEAVARRHGAAGLPAYFRLEAARMYLTEGRIVPAMAAVLSSPRAMRSLLSLRTWRIIWMGQKLRRWAAGLATLPPLDAHR